ncbi:MAG: bifunctional 3,4-dihydroxy-2-butanone-4-phosphate synthase/GTP cyclohydrolase II [Microcoleaceae cyanobacterium]
MTQTNSLPAGFTFDSVESALAELKAGHCVVVVDDEHRENEGDLVGAAQFATPDMINFMAVHARGLICLALTGDRLDQLDLPLMVANNTDSNQTAFTVSIDAAPNIGVSTGISAEDRALTIQVAINPNTKPEDLRRPGHIFPLRARAGGVLRRAGHTEAGVDLARLAGLYPGGVICEIQNPDGSMARLPELINYAREHDLKLISIADLISYRLKHDRFIQRESVAKLPTQFGEFLIYAYRNLLDQSEHVAIVKGDPAEFQHGPVMVRVHSECLTGDAFGSLRCDCRMQLQTALKMINHQGRGVVVYLRQEGRGIGLINKLKAYSLQDMGLDTVEANERLGFPADLRNYGTGAQILNDIGVKQICMITNNPRKIAGLKGYGIEVVDRVPLLIEATDYNSVYLSTKAKKLGHLLLQTYLVTVSLQWHEQAIRNPILQEQPKAIDQTLSTPALLSSAVQLSDRSAWLEKLTQLAANHQLLLQEEQRPVAVALFDESSLIFHLGLDQPCSIGSDWYQDAQHAHVKAIGKILDQVATWPGLQKLEFLVAPGCDPLTSLKVQLDRQVLSLAQPPSSICEQLKSQTIYSFRNGSPM